MVSVGWKSDRISSIIPLSVSIISVWPNFRDFQWPHSSWGRRFTSSAHKQIFSLLLIYTLLLIVFVFSFVLMYFYCPNLFDFFLRRHLPLQYRLTLTAGWRICNAKILKGTLVVMKTGHLQLMKTQTLSSDTLWVYNYVFFTAINEPCRTGWQLSSLAKFFLLLFLFFRPKYFIFYRKS